MMLGDHLAQIDGSLKEEQQASPKRAAGLEPARRPNTNSTPCQGRAAGISPRGAPNTWCIL
jgi:hypothetical protein